MELSSRVEYALLALIELASHPTPAIPLKIGEITAKQPMPERYLEQIFTGLRREGIVQSQRGARGGYTLAREPWQITVLEIISVIEGHQQGREEEATIEKDLVHEVWQQASQAADSILGRYTLQDLCQRRDIYKQINPMYHI